MTDPSFLQRPEDCLKVLAHTLWTDPTLGQCFPCTGLTFEGFENLLESAFYRTGVIPVMRR